VSDTKTEFKPGDVVRYTPENRWCREGTAVMDERGRLVDTYWYSGGDALSAEEVAVAQFQFNLADYDEVGSESRWSRHNPTDRQRITRQHGLSVRWLVRKGAQPDLATQIDNARQAVADAYEKLRSAEFGVELAWAELKRLEAGQ
jgi:hypothetical protein